MMDRRQLLAVMGATGLTALAGCSGGSDDGNGVENENNDGSSDSDSVTPVALSDENRDIQNQFLTLSVRYNSRTAAQFDPPNESVQEAESGNKMVIVRCEVGVDTRREDSEPIDVYGSAFKLRADGVYYDLYPSIYYESIDQTVAPGTLYTGWMIFEVPEDTSEATLTTQDADAWFDLPVDILFQRDSSLSTSF